MPAFLHSPLFKVVVYFAAICLGAALLAPPLYWGGKHVVAEGWLIGTIAEDLHGSMDRATFTRYFNRAVLIVAVLLIGPLLRWMRQGQQHSATVPENATRPEKFRARFGLTANPRWWQHLSGGFALAGGTLLALGGIYLLAGWYEAKEETKAIGSIVIDAATAAFAVAFLEEFVFRAALHGMFLRLMRPLHAWWIGAALFALLHFFHSPKGMSFDTVTAGSGLQLIGALFAGFFAQFGQLNFLLAEFAVLFSVGLVLGYTRMKTASLWLPIGLHAGWVFGVKVFSPLCTQTFAAGEKMPWIGGSLRVGLLSTLVVTVTGLLLAWWLSRRNSRPALRHT